MIAGVTHDPPAPMTVRWWIPAGLVEIEMLAGSGWRAWPSAMDQQPGPVAYANHRDAVRTAREQHVRLGGVGYVVAVDVRCDYPGRLGQVEGGWAVPGDGIEEFNANVVGVFRENAEFRGPVSDSEFDDAQTALGFAFPSAWRDVLQRQSWFRRGWLESGWFVEFNTPQETVELHRVWDTSVALHPGIAVIGGDGSRELLCLDLREDPAPVLLVDVTSAGWEDNPRQSDDVETFIAQIEDGTFDFTW
jgi:hypothetical protein